LKRKYLETSFLDSAESERARKALAEDRAWLRAPPPKR
jgi:hypothetical protein